MTLGASAIWDLGSRTFVQRQSVSSRSKTMDRSKSPNSRSPPVTPVKQRSKVDKSPCDSNAGSACPESSVPGSVLRRLENFKLEDIPTSPPSAHSTLSAATLLLPGLESSASSPAPQRFQTADWPVHPEELSDVEKPEATRLQERLDKIEGDFDQEFHHYKSFGEPTPRRKATFMRQELERWGWTKVKGTWSKVYTIVIPAAPARSPSTMPSPPLASPMKAMKSSPASPMALKSSSASPKSSSAMKAMKPMKSSSASPMMAMKSSSAMKAPKPMMAMKSSSAMKAMKSSLASPMKAMSSSASRTKAMKGSSSSASCTKAMKPMKSSLASQKKKPDGIKAAKQKSVMKGKPAGKGHAVMKVAMKKGVKVFKKPASKQNTTQPKPKPSEMKAFPGQEFFLQNDLQKAQSEFADVRDYNASFKVRCDPFQACLRLNSGHVNQ